MLNKVVFIVGPTAIGKTEAAVALAKKINAEIISCDSMQVYKGMDIISSQPPQQLQKQIPHHLLGVVPADREYNVSRYCKDALQKIKEILKRGRIPLFAGGAGLYMSILLDGIFKVRSENKNIRHRLYQEAGRLGSRYLYQGLQKVDPEAAKKIHPNDTRRLVRALEVFESTGYPISKLQKQRRGLADAYAIKIFCLNMEREKLYKRIDKRVDLMFKRGFIQEVKNLLRLKLGQTASYAIGLRELKGYFDGLYDLKEAKRLIKRNTRIYAKRQLTWFRKDKRIVWIQVNEREKPEAIAKRIWKEHYSLP